MRGAIRLACCMLPPSSACEPETRRGYNTKLRCLQQLKGEEAQGKLVVVEVLLRIVGIYSAGGAGGDTKPRRGGMKTYSHQIAL
ncbi:MAG: hypothetical protein ABJ059_18905, partial [Hyphomicrobiales bacterium]